MVERRTGNRFTGATTLTDREARQIARYILKLQKMANKENRWVREVRDLEFIARQMYDLIENAGREEVLLELQVERSPFRG